MKTQLPAISLCLFALTFPATADTFFLKDGSKLEAKILREDATTYVLEVQVTKSIKDEKTVAKADVKKIEREQVAQPGVATIRQLLPVPDLMPATDYAKRISTVEKYIAEHRMTSTSKEAQAVLESLKAEAAEIAAGGIKLDGKIYSSEERRTNAYDLDARMEAAKIRSLVAAGQALQALRAFDEFQHDFPNTEACSELLPVMTQVITSYLAETATWVKSYDARVNERKTGLERMPVADRRSSETAIRDQTAELAAQFKREKDAKLDWVTRHPFSKPALDDTMTFGTQELARLAAMKSAPPVDGGKAFRDAMTLILLPGKPAEVKSAIAAAKTAMVPERYLALLQAAVPGGAPPPANP